MARPCKSAKVLADYTRTKAEISARIECENKLKGESSDLKPPKHLNTEQKKIFKFILSNLEKSGILGELDAYVLSECSICIDRMQALEDNINKNPQMMFDVATMRAKAEYNKAFFRYCNELCLSPQSRAKMANINLQSQKEENPLLKALSDDD